MKWVKEDVGGAEDTGKSSVTQTPYSNVSEDTVRSDYVLLCLQYHPVFYFSFIMDAKKSAPIYPKITQMTDDL